jgi:pyruvate dehydrogenase E1 component alpha subunit
MMCELFGRAGGTSGGKGGSMHIADFSKGMLGANGVVPDGVTIAVGAAHAIKMQKRSEIVVAFFGDGAMNRGPLFEAFNWAKLFDLPVLFVCEDNRWSATTSSAPMIGGEGASARAESLGIQATRVDGNNVEAVWTTAKELVAHVRAGHGPRLLHAITYRVKGHVSVDLAAYRDPAELAAALLTDPINRTRQRHQALSGDMTALDRIDQAAKDEVQAALNVAGDAPWPEANSAFTDIQTTGAGQWY